MKGINYKGKESYVTSIWKTQVEISVDHGYVNQDEMERFLFELQPVNMELGKTILHTSFHLLSFQAKRSEMGEIGRCREWNAPDDVSYVNLLIHEKLNWKLESVGFEMTKRSMYTGTKLINYMHFGFVDIKQSVLSYFFMDNELWPKTNYKRVRVLFAP